MTDRDSSSPVQSVGNDGFGIHRAAYALAHRHNLLEPDGQIRCWNCDRLGAVLPHLHCRRCYQAAIDRENEIRDALAHESEESRQWRAIGERMQDRSLELEAATRLLDNALALPSATPERRAELQRIFDARFQNARRQQPKQAGRGYRSQV